MSQTYICILLFTFFRFEVPLRPSYAVPSGPGSSSQLQQDPSVVRNSHVHHARGRKKVSSHKANETAYRTVHSVQRKKKSRSSHPYSKEKSKAPDNSRRLTDFFVTHEGTVVLVQ